MQSFLSLWLNCVCENKHWHKSSTCCISSAGWRGPRLRSGESTWPCPPSCRTSEGSLVGGRLLSLSETETHTQVLSHIVWPSEICTCPQYHNWSKKTLNYSFWILEYRYRPHKSIIDRAAMRKMSVSLSVKKAKVENLQDLKTFIFYTKIVNKLIFFSNESFDMNWVMNQPVRLWSPRWSCLRSALWPPPLYTLHYHQASRLSSSLRESDQNVSQSVLSWHVGEGKRLFKSLFRWFKTPGWQFLCLTVNTSLSL